MKGKKQRSKVIPHCYRRTLSRTLSNSSVSQLVQIGSYKKRINDLSRNNRHLATALQEARIEAAVQSNVLKDCARDCNKILLARLKINEMAKNLAKFVTDLEEVRSCLDVDLLSDNKPFILKNKSSNDRLRKEPVVTCIEEVTEESSLNVVVSPENVPTVPDLALPNNTADKMTDVVPSTSKKTGDFINEENLEMPPILFAEDSDEKKKKSSTKRKTSKVSFDPNNGSLTPQLNIDATCIKLKKNSNRRQSHFVFPDSRSTSRGKSALVGKENSPEDLATHAKTSSSLINNQGKEMGQENADIFKSPINDNEMIKDKESENLSIPSENHLQTVVNAPQPYFTNVSTINTENSSKTAAVPEVQPGESNHTVLFCVDMELTEVIRPVHQIIVENGLSAEVNSLNNAVLDSDIAKEPKESDTLVLYNKVENSVYTKETTTKIYSPELINTHLTASEPPTDNNVQLPEINEDDEVLNVGIFTFCEPNDKDGSIAGRSTKSSRTRKTRLLKPVKYAVYFSSDESDADSPFETLLKTNKRKTVVSNKTDGSCEKAKDTASHRKVSSELESGAIKNDLEKCTVDALHLEKYEKHLEKKPSKKSRDIKISGKKDLSKQPSQKCSATSYDGNFKLKKKSEFSYEKVKKTELSHENMKKKELNHENVKKEELNHENVKKKELNHENVKKSGLNHENIKNLIFSPMSSPCSILKKKNDFNFQSTKELVNETPVNKLVLGIDLDDSITDSPMSESRKVAFAPTDLVCNFKKMSVSRKISKNKKVRRTSKSALDFQELTKTSQVSADNFSESRNIQKSDKPIIPDFSGDTELYTFSSPKTTDPLSIPTTDDLMRKFIPSSNASQKNKNNRLSKKVLPASKPAKTTGKLSLKKSKDPKNTEPQPASGEKRDISIGESPVSSCTPVKRKSLFKEDSLDDSKENVYFDFVPKKFKAQEKNKNDNTNMNSELSNQNNHAKQSTSSKSQSKVQRKTSTKKLSIKQKLFEPTPEIKSKKNSMAVKSRENSPVLRDSVNLPESLEEITSKRRSKTVNYKEPSLTKKLRRA